MIPATTTSGMTCAEAARILHEFVDGALPPAERQRLAEHLRTCPPCRESAGQIRCMRDVIGRLPREPMPDGLRSKLLSRLRRAADGAPPGRDDSNNAATRRPAPPGQSAPDERLEDVKNPGRRLPTISLVSAHTGTARPLRDHGRTAPVIVLAHSADCSRCESFIADLARERQSILDWDGEIVVVRSGASSARDDAQPPAETPFRVLMDPDALLAGALDIEAPAIVVADQWAVVHVAEGAGPEHRFISPAEIAEWVKYLAVQCPECEGESV